MRVERTLISLGLILALAGLIVAYNGYIYVNVDRGPPTMVSGVLTFGFGLVIAAMGFAVRELQAIAADASKVALLLAKNRTAALSGEFAPAPAGPPPAAPFQQTPETEAFPARESPLQDFRSNDFGKDVETASADTGADRTGASFVSGGVKPEKPRPSLFARKPSSRPEGQATPLAMPSLSWMVKPGNAVEPATKSEDDWRNQAISAETGAAPRDEQPVGQEIGQEIGAGKSAGDENRAESEAPKPEVMGRYEAHGAHYTMFADGSIEAETQHGVYRFASIDELKRFIEGEQSGDVTAKS